MSSMPKSGMRRHRIIKINLPLAAPLANRQDSCVLSPDLVRYEKKAGVSGGKRASVWNRDSSI